MGLAFSGLSRFCFRITNRLGSITSLSTYSIPGIFLRASHHADRIPNPKKKKKSDELVGDGGAELGIIREVGHVEGVDLSRAEGLVVAGDVVEWGEREVVEDEVAVERVGVEPQLVAEADPRHVRARRRREPASAVGPRGRRRLPRRQRRRRHRSAGTLCIPSKSLGTPSRRTP